MGLCALLALSALANVMGVSVMGKCGVPVCNGMVALCNYFMLKKGCQVRCLITATVNRWMLSRIHDVLRGQVMWGNRVVARMDPEVTDGFKRSLYYGDPRDDHGTSSMAQLVLSQVRAGDGH
jgi:hypothetical protein